MLKQNLLSITVLLFLFSCNQKHNYSETEEPSQKKEMLYIIDSLHQLECEYLKKGGITADTFSTYDFRAAAFQEILKETNRKILVDYEIKYQKLASLEFDLTKNQKAEYDKTVDEIYSQPCK
jgi:hypothetical protein